MFSIILGIIIYIVSICTAFYLGRHYAIIKRDKLLNEQESDIFDEVKEFLHEKQNPHTAREQARIISPSKVKAESLKEFENTSI